MRKGAHALMAMALVAVPGFGCQDKVKAPAKQQAPAPMTADEKDMLKNRELLENLELLQNFEQIQFYELLGGKKTDKNKEKASTRAPAKNSGKKL